MPDTAIITTATTTSTDTTVTTDIPEFVTREKRLLSLVFSPAVFTTTTDITDTTAEAISTDTTELTASTDIRETNATPTTIASDGRNVAKISDTANARILFTAVKRKSNRTEQN